MYIQLFKLFPPFFLSFPSNKDSAVCRILHIYYKNNIGCTYPSVQCAEFQITIGKNTTEQSLIWPIFKEIFTQSDPNVFYKLLNAIQGNRVSSKMLHVPYTNVMDIIEIHKIRHGIVKVDRENFFFFSGNILTKGHPKKLTCSRLSQTKKGGTQTHN